MKSSRRAFLHHLSAATLLAGVPSWARAQAQALADQAQVDTDSGQSITIALNPEPPVLVCFANTSATSVVTSTKIIEGLLEYDHQLKPQPQLATNWQVSEDGLRYTFELRQGVTWHDGAPFSADDVVFSIQTVRKYHPRGAATFAHLESITALDSHTVVLELNRPAPYLLLALSAGETPILPAHRYTLEQALQNPLNNAPIGTGPYRFKEWVRGSHLIYERNPNYWLESQPQVQQLIFRMIPDSAARFNGFKSGAIDLGADSPVALSEIKNLSQSGHIAVTTRGYEYNAIITALEFNLDREELAKPEVRQAIAHALNRDQIKQIAFYGYADTTVAPISKKSFPHYHLAIDDPYPYDIKRANQLLDEAGYPKQSNGFRFQLQLHANPFNTGFKRTAAYIRSTLARIGIQAILHDQEPGSYIRSVYTQRDFDLTVSGVSTMFDPTVGLQRIYWSKSFTPDIPFSNANHYQNPEVDALLEAAAIEMDEIKRAELFKAFQHIVVHDIPSIALVQVNDVTLSHHRVRGFDTTAAGVQGNLAQLEVIHA